MFWVIEGVKLQVSDGQLTRHVTHVIRMTFLHFVHGAQRRLGPTDEVI